MGGGGDKSKSAAGGIEEMVSRTVFKHLSKSTREVALTIYWTRGSGEMNFSVSNLWVNLNQELVLGE